MLSGTSAGYGAAMTTAAAHTADGAGSPVNVLARAALAGAATGARSLAGAGIEDVLAISLAWAATRV